MNDANLPAPLIAAVIAGTVSLLVVVITGAISLLTLAINTWVTGRRERLNRRRDIFAKAFATAVAYEEFPYVVRRRRASDPEGERIRISTELRKVQEEIAYHSAWLSTESWHVSKAYDTLIRKVREVAGGEIRKAWCEPPIDSDAQMNMPDLGLGALQPFKQVYLLEVIAHLSRIPRWPRSLSRAISKVRLPHRSQRAIVEMPQGCAPTLPKPD
jgi:hypothetical protein